VLVCVREQTHWLLTKAETTLSEREARYLAALKLLCPQIAQAQHLFTTFQGLPRGHILTTMLTTIGDPSVSSRRQTAQTSAGKSVSIWKHMYPEKVGRRVSYTALRLDEVCGMDYWQANS
jgi:hypothetical protein